MKQGKYESGKPIEEGPFCRVLLGTDDRGTMPCLKEFFEAKSVGDQDKRKMHGRLRLIARSGFPNNREAYKRFGDLHYVKIHGFRAYCFDRDLNGVKEVIVCSIEPKKSDDALSDEIEKRARRVFAAHCRRYE